MENTAIWVCASGRHKVFADKVKEKEIEYLGEQSVHSLLKSPNSIALKNINETDARDKGLRVSRIKSRSFWLASLRGVDGVHISVNGIMEYFEYLLQGIHPLRSPLFFQYLENVFAQHHASLTGTIKHIYRIRHIRRARFLYIWMVKNTCNVKVYRH